jgi:hypothetical protein
LLTDNEGNMEHVEGARLWLRIAAAGVALAVLAGAAGAVMRATKKTHPALDTAQAATSTSCATRLLGDWSDGRIEGTYPIRCYRAALEALPSDLQIYSTAPDDIAQALSQRIVRSHAGSSDERVIRKLAGTAKKK